MPERYFFKRTLCAAVLIFTLSALTSHSDEGVDAAEHGEQPVRIAFVTNRTVIEGNKGTDRFGDEAGVLTYGSCHVEFKPIGFLKDAARHISLRFPTEMEDIIDLEEMEADAFWTSLEAVVAAGENKIAFYIHGYNMDFDKACRRTALMQRELGPGVVLLLFAWPSQDNFALYTKDETRLKNSVPAIRSVLDRMLASFGTGIVDAVGHSLGTRGVTNAIAGMEPGETPLFDELVLVAPDMDRFDFDAARPVLARAVSDITIYVSENDGPLRVSQEVHGVPRIGQAGEYLILFDGVETIDISNAPRRDIYGHNYLYFNSRITSDMRILLTQGARAGERPGLLEKSANGKTYWEMTAEDK